MSFKIKCVLLILISTLVGTSCNQNKIKENKKSEKKSESSLIVHDLLKNNKLNEWKGWKKDTPGRSWQFENGTLHFDPTVGDGGDILTKEVYENFVLSLEWKVQECGNSGIFFNVQESEEYQNTYFTGPEMQILDNSCHPDGKIDKHRAGDLYDLIETNIVNVKEAGEWNKVKIKSDHGKVEFWQNDEIVVSFTMFDEQWNNLIANSKFKDWKGFGQFRSGHIALQDHGDHVWFRNIQIKILK